MSRGRLAGATRAQAVQREPARDAALRAACAVLLLACAAPAHAAAPPGAPVPLTPQQYSRHFHNLNPEESVPMRVRVSPAPSRLGQAMTYHGVVLVEPGVVVHFEPPQSGGAMSWSQVRAGRSKRGWTTVANAPDSVWLEARLQIFDTGPVVVPGPVVQIKPFPGTTRAGKTRLPMVRLVVLPSITAADSDAQLRPLRGPLAAPWWERLPWPAITGAMLLVATAVLLVRAVRRRKPRPVPRTAPAVTTARPRLDPAAVALRALAALRTRELPAAGRFGEHALELTAILRRFLESTLALPRPGDTSGELLGRLLVSHVPEDDFDRLEGLLLLWDRVKFARAALTETEALNCEEAVEGYVRRVTQARAEANTARAEAARLAAAGAGAPPRPGGTPPSAPEAA